MSQSCIEVLKLTTISGKIGDVAAGFPLRHCQCDAGKSKDNGECDERLHGGVTAV